MEERLPLLKRLVFDMERNFRGYAENVDVSLAHAQTVAQAIRDALNESASATDGAVNTLKSYRATVREIEGNNLARTLRIANGRLGDALDEIDTLLRGYVTDSRSVSALLKKRLGT